MKPEWKAITGRTASARRPSMSLRYSLALKNSGMSPSEAARAGTRRRRALAFYLGDEAGPLATSWIERDYLRLAEEGRSDACGVHTRCALAAGPPGSDLLRLDVHERERGTLVETVEEGEPLVPDHVA